MLRALSCLLALLLAPAAALAQASPWDAYSRVFDVASAPYTGAVAVTLDTTYAPGRALRLNCSAGGNVALTLLDGSTETYVASTGYSVIPLAVTRVSTSGTTATCTYALLK